MFEEIGKYISSNGLAIGIALILLTLTIDKSAAEKLKNKKYKVILLIATIAYFISIADDIIKIMLLSS